MFALSPFAAEPFSSEQQARSYSYAASGGVVFGGTALTSYQSGDAESSAPQSHGRGWMRQRGLHKTFDRYGYKPAIPEPVPARPTVYRFIASGGITVGGAAGVVFDPSTVYTYGAVIALRQRSMYTNSHSSLILGCDPEFMLLAAA